MTELLSAPSDPKSLHPIPLGRQTHPPGHNPSARPLRGRRNVSDRAAYARSSQTEFVREIVIRDSKTRSLPRASSTANISLILQCLECPIKELWRDDDRTTTRAARDDLDGLALGGRDVIALLIAELGKGDRDHH